VADKIGNAFSQILCRLFRPIFSQKKGNEKGLKKKDTEQEEIRM